MAGSTHVLHRTKHSRSVWIITWQLSPFVDSFVACRLVIKSHGQRNGLTNAKVIAARVVEACHWAEASSSRPERQVREPRGRYQFRARSAVCMYVRHGAGKGVRRPWGDFMTWLSWLISVFAVIASSALYRSSTRRRLAECVVGWPQRWPLAPAWRTPPRNQRPLRLPIVDGKHTVSQSDVPGQPSTVRHIKRALWCFPHTKSIVCSFARSVGVTRCSCSRRSIATITHSCTVLLRLSIVYVFPEWYIHCARKR